MERWCALLKADSPEKSSACQRLVEPRTRSGRLPLSVSAESVQTHCVLIIYPTLFFSLSFSHLLPASRWSLQLQMFVPAQFSCLISHIWSLSAVCWSMKVWTTVGCQGQWFERREVTGELILTSPSPQRLCNTWRVFGHRGFLFSWAWSFGFEMKQEKTHTFNIQPIKIMLNHIFETAEMLH